MYVITVRTVDAEYRLHATDDYEHGSYELSFGYCTWI